MSSEPAIAVKGLSKAYQMYAQPHDRLKQFIYPRLRRAVRLKNKSYYKDFWALKDISFAIEPGTTMGIIGRNGSGKSTLLQLVCGTLTPTQGEVNVKGRVAAMLELGSGFNPDFTGRQNVYMNATVLGLKQSQIDERFESIEQFADIGDFINQPVSTYSSGMMVRLAFAVIAHVDADILIIDEALAVGDAVFTQKCMRWLRHFQKEGTILFVSHDASSIRKLCSKAMWLHDGQCMEIGDAKSVSENYLQFTQQQIAGDEIKMKALYGDDNNINQEDPGKIIGYASAVKALGNIEGARGFASGEAEVTEVVLESLDKPGNQVFDGGEKVRLIIRGKCERDIEEPIIGFYVCDRFGQELFGDNTLKFTDHKKLPIKAGGILQAEFEFRLPYLPNGHYEILTSFAEGDLSSHRQLHWLFNASILQVSSSQVNWGVVGIPFDKILLQDVTQL